MAPVLPCGGAVWRAGAVGFGTRFKQSYKVTDSGVSGGGLKRPSKMLLWRTCRRAGREVGPLPHGNEEVRVSRFRVEFGTAPAQ